MASGCSFSSVVSLPYSQSPPLPSPLGVRRLKWHTVADCRPGLWVLALAGWICVAAGEPAALFLACSINSGSSGTDWSHALISDSGADAQLLRCYLQTGGEEVGTKLSCPVKWLRAACEQKKKKKAAKNYSLNMDVSRERLTKCVSCREEKQNGLSVYVSKPAADSS